MGVSFGGFNSGLPVNDIISQLMEIERRPINQIRGRIQKVQSDQSEYGKLESVMKRLQGSIKKITADSVIDTNLFQAKKPSSSDETVLTATAGANASLQTYNVEIKRLATASQASGVSSVGQSATESTRLNAIPSKAFNTGTFKVFVNGIATEISVNNETETVGDILTKLRGVSGVSSASISADGVIQVTPTSPPMAQVQLGSNGDTSNFLKLTKLDTPAVETGTGVQTAGAALSTFNVNATDLATAGLRAPIAVGDKFKIGNAEFTIQADKSINDLLTEINSNADANVIASFNANTGKVSLVSKITGNSPINLQDVTGSALQSLGLVVGSGATANSLTSQTLGTNAEVVVNGTSILSASNEVSDTTSGFTGLNLNLKKTNVGQAVQVTVGRDTEALNKAFTEFVTEFNAVVGGIRTLTDAKTGRIGPDNRLNSLRNTLRQSMLGFTNTGEFRSLVDIGLSTGAPTNAANGVTNTDLQFDSAKLQAALTKNPQAVEQLIRGASGVFRNVKQTVDTTLAVGDAASGNTGLFQAARTSSSAQIERMNRTIQQQEDRLVRRERLLRRQYTTSDQLIGQYQAQGQAISNLGAQLSQR
jgi:flagellar capping protein FliD